MPDNPFRPAEQVEPKVKALLYGASGVGKTFCALTAPGRIAVVDSEGGTAFYANRIGAELSPFDVLPTKTFAEVEAAIAFLRANPETYETLVIDPVTVLYETLQDAALRYRTGKAEAKARSRQEAFDADNVDLEQLDWQRIKRAYKRLMTDLVNLPVNVIVIAREADLTEERMENGRKQRVKIGAKPDAEKSTPYYFDMTVRLVPGARDGRDAVIEKDRTGTHALAARIHNPTFALLFGKAIAAGGSGERHLQSEDDAAQADAATLTAGTAEATLSRPDGSWAGKAVAGNPPADFETRETPDGPAVAFRLTSGRKSMKVTATGPLAVGIAEYRDAIEGYEVVCWGSASEESFNPAGAKRPVTYQVLALERITGDGWALPHTPDALAKGSGPLHADTAADPAHAEPTETPSAPVRTAAEIAGVSSENAATFPQVSSETPRTSGENASESPGISGDDFRAALERAGIDIPTATAKAKELFPGVRNLDDGQRFELLLALTGPQDAPSVPMFDPAGEAEIDAALANV